MYLEVNQNVIASVDSEKISTKEFVDYLKTLNEKQIKDLPKTDLVEKILSSIGKVMALEMKSSVFQLTIIH